MQKGKSLIELATAVQEQAARKVDVITDTRNTVVDVSAEGKAVVWMKAENPADTKRAELTAHAIGQIEDHQGIPRGYATRMLTEAPRLFEQNVNYWLHNKPALRMFRLLTPTEGKQITVARAVMSNRYQRIDFDQMLAHVLPEITGQNMQVVSTELTERKMYIKIVLLDRQGETRAGDIVQYGFELRGSEIGEGALDALPFIRRKVCDNGLILTKEIDDTRLRRAHIGKALEAGIDYADDTVKADDKLIMLRLRDTIRAFLNPQRWEAVLARLQAATADTTQVPDPIATVERLADMLTLPKQEHNGILASFLKNGDLSRWGLVNAITEQANTIDDYDRGAELEDAGGRILTLPASDWRVLAKAA